ncbi:MAG: rfaQ [Verrucomicrobiales bacterium]|nr:rfaQ [Verrucomicrobiales bacterium]
MSRILLLQLKRIGDAVLTAPSLAALRAALPDAHLTLALAGAAAQLGPVFTDADAVLTWTPEKPNLRFWRHLLTRKPDIVLDFSGTDRSALLSLASRAPVRAGYDKFAQSLLHRRAWNQRSSAQVRELHTIDFHQTLLPAAGLPLPAVPDSGHLKIPENTRLPAYLPAQYIVVHPGTAREEKFWPPERWAAVLDHLHATYGLPLLLTGGTWEFEMRHQQSIFRLVKAPVLDLAGRITLPQLAAIIARARMAITVDTAAMHLAAAFQVPQIGLFGPTNPFHWAPRQPRAVVLRAGYSTPENADSGGPPQPRQASQLMTELSMETVRNAADRLMTATANDLK